MSNKYTSCLGPQPCSHSAGEHVAFDLGVQMGRAGETEEACPYRNALFREAFLAGWSVGHLEYKSAHDTQCLPCPGACGGFVSVQGPMNDQAYFVRCACGWSGPKVWSGVRERAIAEAIRRWNHR